MESMPSVARAIGVSESLLRNFIRGRDAHGRTLPIIPHNERNGHYFLESMVAYEHVKKHCRRPPKTLRAPIPTDEKDNSPWSPEHGMAHLMMTLEQCAKNGGCVFTSEADNSAPVAAVSTAEDLEILETVYDPAHPAPRVEVKSLPYMWECSAVEGEDFMQKCRWFTTNYLKYFTRALADGVDRLLVPDSNNKDIAVGALISVKEYEWLLSYKKAKHSADVCA